MTQTVDFYYGLGSRYSYLAATQIAGIEARTGAVFRWRPFQSSRLIAHDGNDPFAGQPQSGQYDWDYRKQDGADWAAFYGVTFREPVGRLRYDKELVALAALAGGRQGAVVAMSHRIFRLIFSDERTEIARDDYLTEARAQGLDGVRFEADLDSPDLAAEHDAIIEEAASRGAFGAPSFLVGGRMFWGNDRLPLVEAAIRGLI